MVTQSHPQDVLRKLEEGIVICQPGCGGPRLVSLENGLDARYLIIDLSLMDALAPHLHKVPNKDNIKPLWVGSFTVTAERSWWSMAQSWEHGAAGVSDWSLHLDYNLWYYWSFDFIIDHWALHHCRQFNIDCWYYLLLITALQTLNCCYDCIHYWLPILFYCWSYCPFGTTTIDHWLLQIYHWYLLLTIAYCIVQVGDNLGRMEGRFHIDYPDMTTGPVWGACSDFVAEIVGMRMRVCLSCAVPAQSD